jgi:hypothetical protein
MSGLEEQRRHLGGFFSGWRWPHIDGIDLAALNAQALSQPDAPAIPGRESRRQS